MNDEELPPIAARIGHAFTEATEAIEPAPDGWERIAGRLDEPVVIETNRAAASPMMFLVAAAALVVVVLGATLAFRGGSASEPRVETLAAGTVPTSAFVAKAVDPGSSGAPAIVAVTADDRLVELDRDGREVRQIYAGPTLPTNVASAFFLDGPIAVSPVDRTIYLERQVPNECDYAYVASYDTVGEIVAIPFAGGEPRVVVAAGTRPAISRDGNRLAYLAPGGGKHCDGSHNEWSMYVKDVSTPSGAAEPLVLKPTASVDGIAPLQPAWTDYHGGLVLQARRPDADNRAGRCPTCGPVTYLWVYRLDERGAEVSPFGNDVRSEGAMAGPPAQLDDEREVFDVAASPPASTGLPQVTVIAGGVRGEGRIALAETTIGAPNVRTTGDRSLVDIDPSLFGDGPYVAASIDASPGGGQVLVLATSAPNVPDGERVRSVVLVEGSSLRLLGRGFRAVAWVP